jgi:hypothetical protein
MARAGFLSAMLALAAASATAATAAAVPAGMQYTCRPVHGSGFSGTGKIEERWTTCRGARGIAYAWLNHDCATDGTPCKVDGWICRTRGPGNKTSCVHRGPWEWVFFLSD